MHRARFLWRHVWRVFEFISEEQDFSVSHENERKEDGIINCKLCE